MNPILQFLQKLPKELVRAATQIIVVASIFPIMSVVGSFGHLPLMCEISAALVATIMVWLRQKNLFPMPAFCVIGIGLLAVALMGIGDTTATDTVLYTPGPMRYIGVLVGAAFWLVPTLILAIAAWGGTFLVVGAVAGLPGGLHFRDIPPTAKESFEALCIVSFWIGIVGAFAGIMVPRIPYELALLLLLLLLLVVPGALVLAGRTSLKIAWGITVALLLVGLVASVWYALDSFEIFEQIGLSGVKRITFRIAKNGFPAPDPLESVSVRAGDKIFVDAFGIIQQKGVRQSLRGDTNNALPEDGWYRYSGEMVLVVANTDGSGKLVHVPILLNGIKSGAEQKTSFLGFKTAYRMTGDGVVPNKVAGRILVGFYKVTPDGGFVRMSLKIQRGPGTKERLLGQEKPMPEKNEWRIFFRVLGLIALAALVIGGPISAYRSPQGVFFHLPTIVLYVGIATLMLFVGDSILFESAPTSFWNQIVAWWKK